MTHAYTAKLAIKDHILAEKTGDDIDDLYTWLLAKAQGEFGDLEGEIVDNQSGKVVKSFRKSPPD